MLGLIEGPVGFLEKFGANGGKLFVFIGVVLLFAILFFMDISLSAMLGFVILTAPIWLPVTTFFLFFEVWMEYVRRGYDLNQGRVTLEIKLPQDVFKSPEAMELVLQQLYQTASPDNHFQTYLDGKKPPTYGLELVSRGGDVRFYMSLPRKKFKQIAETQLYAQYPGIEIRELELDYTCEIPWDPDRYSYFSIHFGKKKAEGLPFKTYLDYGLQDMPKEEEKIDPISTVIDTLAAIGPGEYIWIQILIDANREVDFKTGSLEGVHPDWRESAKEEMQKILDAAKKRAGDQPGGNIMMQLTDTEKDTLKSIERNIGKVAFNTAIRAMYIGTRDAFNPGERIGAIITMWRSFEDLNRNSVAFRWRTDFDWNMFQDPTGKRKVAMKKQEFTEYKLRAYTQKSGADGKKAMTTEELATLFHFPGKVVATPTLERIPSKRGEAPANLPTA